MFISHAGSHPPRFGSSCNIGSQSSPRAAQLCPAEPHALVAAGLVVPRNRQQCGPLASGWSLPHIGNHLGHHLIPRRSRHGTIPWNFEGFNLYFPPLKAPKRVALAEPSATARIHVCSKQRGGPHQSAPRRKPESETGWHNPLPVQRQRFQCALPFLKLRL